MVFFKKIICYFKGHLDCPFTTELWQRGMSYSVITKACSRCGEILAQGIQHTKLIQAESASPGGPLTIIPYKEK